MVLSSHVPHTIAPTSGPRPMPDTRARQRRRIVTSGRARVAREVLTIVFGALLYFFVRGLMDSQAAVALANARSLISLERQVGIFHEPSMQGWITGDQWLVNLANRIYIFGHWPVIAGTMAWMIWKHREWFAVYRSALLISGAIGLVVFVTLPMAPPRFVADQGFIDTVTQHSHAYRVLQPPSFTNQYAAMPSLHVGWNLLMGIAIVRHASTRWARAFGWTMPLVMWIATIVTANHYLVDGVAGSIVALTGLAVAWRISRPRNIESEDGEIVEFQGPVIGQGWNRRRAA